MMALTGCDTIKEQAGLSKRAPDEFTVVTKAPLVMPPDFSLRPPRPGSKRPQEVQPGDKARDVVLQSTGTGRVGPADARLAAQASLTASGRPAQGGEVSQSERSLLSKAGALESDPSIRETVNRETTQLAEKDSSFTDRLIFWQDRPEFGSTVDASAESQRLREAAAKGEAASGGATPVIQHRKRGILEGLFY